MGIIARKFASEDVDNAIAIWNEIVEDGVAFPQMEQLDKQTGLDFFLSQSYTGVAIEEDSGRMVGLYILHPNNVGRCGHICNTSYAVKGSERGKRIGEILVKDSMKQGKRLGYKILQFNAVVSTNEPALRLYKKLGFTQLGIIPGGFLMKNGHYQDIIPHYYVL